MKKLTRLARPENKRTVDDVKWHSSLKKLYRYIEENNCLPAPSVVGVGQWLSGLRQEYMETADKSTLDAQKIAELERLPGWYWRTSYKHNLDFRVYQIKTWMNENPHIERLEGKHKVYFDFRLDKWMSSMRLKKQKGLFNQIEIILIESIPGWEWVPRRLYRRSFIERELIWRVKTLLDTEVRSGSAAGARNLWNCDIVIPEYRIVIEYDGAWTHQFKESSDREKTADLKANDWRVIRLREVPLVCFQKEDILVEVSEEVGRIEARLRAALNTYGVKFKDKTTHHLMRHQGLLEQAHDPWYEGYVHLKDYVETNNHALVPATFTDVSGYRLGQWVYVQRRSRKRETLSERKTRLLNEIPNWRWEVMTEVKIGWQEAYRRTELFFSVQNRLPFAQEYSEDGFKLGAWVSYQRGEYRKGKLSEERKDLLQRLPGWQWSPLEESWQKKYLALIDYIKLFNKYPTQATHHLSLPIGRWLIAQRREARGKLITDAKRQLLEKLPGWSVESARGKRPRDLG